jgi:AcrR family transcriptional regulator
VNEGAMTKHKSPDERAEQILSAARTCFLRKGYFATKMDEIARESGLSKGGVYFHFSSKREIFRALVEEEYDLAMSFLNMIVESDEGFEKKIFTLAEHFMELFSSSDQPRFLVIIGEMALRDDEIAEMLSELQGNYFVRVGELLQRGVDEGELRELDTHATAVVLKAMLDGIQANFALGIDVDLERTVGAAISILMSGIAPVD